MKLKTAILFTLLLLGCSVEPQWEEPSDYIMELDGRLPKDSNGFYHLKLLRDRFQTVHRLRGTLLRPNSDVPHQSQKVSWESSHVWTILPNDTVITIYRRNVNQSGRWVVFDTAYVSFPDTMTVPTVNPSSYTDFNGEFSGMAGPVLPMIGDTLTIVCSWTSKWYQTDTTRSFIRIVLE